MTKSDKIRNAQLFDKCLAIGLQLMKFKNVEHVVHAVSSKTGFGIDHMKYSMLEALEKYPTRDLKGKEETLIKILLENKTLTRKKPAKLTRFAKKDKKLNSQEKTTLLENEKK